MDRRTIISAHEMEEIIQFKYKGDKKKETKSKSETNEKIVRAHTAL